jgi:hypothetical protein
MHDDVPSIFLVEALYKLDYTKKNVAVKVV